MIVKGRIFNPRLRADFPRFARKKIHNNIYFEILLDF